MQSHTSHKGHASLYCICCWWCWCWWCCSSHFHCRWEKSAGLICQWEAVSECLLPWVLIISWTFSDFLLLQQLSTAQYITAAEHQPKHDFFCKLITAVSWTLFSACDKSPIGPHLLLNFANDDTDELGDRVKSHCSRWFDGSAGLLPATIFEKPF